MELLLIKLFKKTENLNKSIIGENTKIKYPLSNEKIKGGFLSFLIKGYGKRAKYSQSLFLFRIGIRKKANLNRVYGEKQESLPKAIIPSSVSIQSKKKATLFILYSSNVARTQSFIQSIIKLQGSSKTLPAYSYKDIGIRYFGKKPRKRVRRVS